MRIIFVVVLIGFLACAYLVLPPLSYPTASIVTIPAGESVRGAGEILKEKGAVNSSMVFALAVRLQGGGVVAGSYRLPGGENVFSLAYRFSRGISALDAVKVTIPEGFSVLQIAARLKDAMPAFDSERFVSEALQEGKSQEGYLFPDTYYLSPSATSQEVLALMRSTFEEKIKSLTPNIQASGRTLDEVVTMASIIEEEARQPETRKIVSGILWKRLDAEMPLQVDAVFAYIHGIPGYTPTAEDLKSDSPFNTYTRKGLPPTPIANPGLDSIDAALHPTKTAYWYYLTGKDGVMYYAKTFEEHIGNKKHLR